MPDELSHDPQQNLRIGGSNGGRAKTPEKVAAVRANVAKARAKRLHYLKHPEDHPSRRKQEEPSE